ncbi:MAG: hypothetical protein AAF747_05095, partial [Planctomycetota bacterium]
YTTSHGAIPTSSSLDKPAGSEQPSQHDRDQGGLGWRSHAVECTVCRHQFVQVIPEVVADLESECPNCEAFVVMREAEVEA